MMRILYLDLDALRPDHLGAYGYHRNTSPNIDSIAAEGVRFDNCYTSDAPCLPSRTAVMSGRFGIHTGVNAHGGTAADMRREGVSRGFHDILGQESLPAFLKKAGMRTVSISPFAERHGAWTFNAGFSEVYNTGRCGLESAEEVTPVVLDWISRNAKQDNWFLHINYWDPHTPYRAPEEFGNPFENEALPSWLSEEVVSSHLEKDGPCSLGNIDMFVRPGYPRQPDKVHDMEGVHRIIDGYDCAVRYMDSHIGMLFDALRNEGVMDDLAIIISADHGENLGELGIYCEHGTADHATCRVPMIIRWPGCKQGHVDEDLHYQLDLAPTLAELMSKPAAASWDGSSLAPGILRGENCPQPYLVITQCAHVCQRGIRFGDYLYIRTYHTGHFDIQNEMLFNLKQDPHEQNNLAETHPELCREAVYLLNEWHDQMMNTMPYTEDPLWVVMKEGGPLHARDYLQWRSHAR